jgi:prephenate dehydrogenase
VVQNSGKNKTRTVYVPVNMLEEVQQWTQQYRRLKQLIRKETQQSLALIHRYAASLRGAGRTRASTSR